MYICIHIYSYIDTYIADTYIACSSMLDTKHASVQTNMSKFYCTIMQTALKKARAFLFLLTCSRMLEHTRAW